jgi:hypothetical protein
MLSCLPPGNLLSQMFCSGACRQGVRRRRRRWLEDDKQTVYVRHNATYLLEMNDPLIQAGLGNVADLTKEFNPMTWTLYVYHATETTTPARS